MWSFWGYVDDRTAEPDRWIAAEHANLNSRGPLIESVPNWRRDGKTATVDGSPGHGISDLERNAALDGLRAVAIGLVVAFHCNRAVAPGGFVGVDIFFALSGFLITSMLWAERASTGTIAFGRFYLRRAIRLWPALVLSLAAYLAVAPIVFPHSAAVRNAFLAGLYLSDYSRAFWGVPRVELNHTWSLSVEAHFYLLWPAVILLLARFAGRRAFFVLIMAFLAATLWRIIDLGLGLDFWRTYYRFDTRMSGLILGGAVAVLPWRPTSAWAESLGIAGLCAIALSLATLQWQTATPLTIGGILVDLASACIVLALAGPAKTVVAWMLSLRPVVYIGRISYSIYLWHYPIIIALRAGPTASLSWWASLIVVAASITIAALSYRFIEKPLISVGRSFYMRSKEGRSDERQPSEGFQGSTSDLIRWRPRKPYSLRRRAR
ncbi:acyltransferase [Mesorhizobium hawassense]|uniref:Acyltransferase n=2 Tax=Mesorhizobium hawassense TaxID=1209954 RepID=A0A330HA10_9HYPH|nr:acyltransferase [Mesorhizobium hawassense]